MMRWTAALLLIASCVRGLEFRVNIPKGGRKCFGEYIARHVLFTVEVEGNPPVSVSIFDPNKVIFEDGDKPLIKSSFTTTNMGNHQVCIENNSAPQNVRVNIQWGPEAKDYAQLAKKEELDPVALKLRKLEDQLKAYHQSVLFLRQREERMRMTNDSTATRTLVMFGMEMTVLLLATLGQVYYLRRFFRNKKLI